MFWNKNSLINRAKEANKLLDVLGIESHTESGREVRTAIAMELLGRNYKLMDKHSKAVFVKQHHEVLGSVRDMLIEEGVLSRPAVQIENKNGKDSKNNE